MTVQSTAAGTLAGKETVSAKCQVSGFARGINYYCDCSGMTAKIFEKIAQCHSLRVVGRVTGDRSNLSCCWLYRRLISGN